MGLVGVGMPQHTTDVSTVKHKKAFRAAGDHLTGRGQREALAEHRRIHIIIYLNSKYITTNNENIATPIAVLLHTLEGLTSNRVRTRIYIPLFWFWGGDWGVVFILHVGLYLLGYVIEYIDE
jgi:hypothetical protein